MHSLSNVFLVYPQKYNNLEDSTNNDSYNSGLKTNRKGSLINNKSNKSSIININSIQNHGFINFHQIKKISNLFSLNDSDKSNYFVYFYDILLCKNTQTYKIDEVKKLLSFNNIVARSFENIEHKTNSILINKK